MTVRIEEESVYKLIPEGFILEQPAEKIGRSGRIRPVASAICFSSFIHYVGKELGKCKIQIIQHPSPPVIRFLPAPPELNVVSRPVTGAKEYFRNLVIDIFIHIHLLTDIIIVRRLGDVIIFQVCDHGIVMVSTSMNYIPGIYRVSFKHIDRISIYSEIIVGIVFIYFFSHIVNSPVLTVYVEHNRTVCLNIYIYDVFHHHLCKLILEEGEWLVVTTGTKDKCLIFPAGFVREQLITESCGLILFSCIKGKRFNRVSHSRTSSEYFHTCKLVQAYGAIFLKKLNVHGSFPILVHIMRHTGAITCNTGCSLHINSRFITEEIIRVGYQRYHR